MCRLLQPEIDVRRYFRSRSFIMLEGVACIETRYKQAQGGSKKDPERILELARPPARVRWYAGPTKWSVSYLNVVYEDIKVR